MIILTQISQITQIIMKKTYSKSELAVLADVSYSTFYRFLKSRREYFIKKGISIYAKKLPRSVVDYLCEEYCFDL